MGWRSKMKENITIVPIWKETEKQSKGFLEKAFEHFDPKTMPEPELKVDLKRKRQKILKK
jgi:hypothetical protein